MLKWDNNIDQPIKCLVLAVSCRDNLYVACVKDNFPTSDSRILLNTDDTSAAATHSPDELISAPALLETVLDYERQIASKRPRERPNLK